MGPQNTEHLIYSIFIFYLETVGQSTECRAVIHLLGSLQCQAQLVICGLFNYRPPYLNIFATSIPDTLVAVHYVCA